MVKDSLAVIASIRKILTATERDVMVQIVRLIVLYEDLKLERGLMQLPENKMLDEVSETYRHAYILRRFFATLLEVDSALIRLNAHPTFKRDLPKFQANQLMCWKAAIGFFAEKKDIIKKRRNAYGGCTAPGFLDTRLRYAAWRSSYCSRASSGVRYASFSRRQHWL